MLDSKLSIKITYSSSLAETHGLQHLFEMSSVDSSLSFIRFLFVWLCCIFSQKCTIVLFDFVGCSHVSLDSPTFDRFASYVSASTFGSLFSLSNASCSNFRFAAGLIFVFFFLGGILNLILLVRILLKILIVAILNVFL